MRKRDLKQEIALCQRHQRVIDEKNHALWQRYQKGELSKEELHRGVTKRNYWRNYYDTHIEHCTVQLDEMTRQRKTVLHNVTLLGGILLLVGTLPFVSNLAITGMATHEITTDRTMSAYVYLLIGGVALFVSMMKKH